MVHCIYLGVTGYNFKKNITFLSLIFYFVLANSADPDGMPPYAVCNSTHLEVSSPQRANIGGLMHASR